MGAKLVGYRGVRNTIGRLPDAMRESSNEVMHQWADDVRETAESLAPVRTGTLKDSIGSFVKEHLGFARVGVLNPDAFYGRFVEFGTSDTQEQPFLRPAFHRHKRGVAKTYRKAVRRRLG